MCGITGYISEKKWNYENMVKLLSHRGPDNSGYFHKKLGRRNVFLGHTRLSILDLSDAGNQPMQTNDRRISVVYNGEIYNYIKLKNQYLSGFKFKSDTDTEVVLYLYKLFGIDFIDLLEGDFAFAIFDEQKAKVYLVRDRMGVKPLYYFHDTKSLVFGSEIKSILAAGIDPVLNDENLQKYFVYKYVPGNETLYKNINRISPGSYIEYDVRNGNCEKKKYWVLKKNKEYSNIGYRDAKEILRNLLVSSVRNRLIADVPVGTFLSGGLDSTIIASIIRDRTDIRHYCAKKSDKDIKIEGTTSDYYYAKRLASQWGLKIDYLDIGKDEANIDMIKKTLWYSDDLIADGSQIPSYLITKEASASSKVILSGMGADELFLGYAGHQLTLMSGYFDKLPGFLSRIISGRFKNLNQGKGGFLAYRRYLHKIGKYYGYPEYKYGFLNIVGDFENSLSVYKGDREDTLDSFRGYFNNNENIYDSLFRFEMDNFLVKNLHYVDRMSMANSIESRVPYLDHRIVEFAYSIPRHFKLSDFLNPKKILKDTFRKDIPEYIIKRRKAGFGMPLRSIFKNNLNVNKLLDKNFLLSINGFSMKAINKLIDNHTAGKEDNSSIIYALVSFQEWYKMNFN